MALAVAAIKPWIDQLVSDGVLPSMTRRFLIDVAVGEPVMVYYQTYADAVTFTPDLARVLMGATAARVLDLPVAGCIDGASI